MKKFISSILGRRKPETDVTIVNQPKPTQWQKVAPPPEVKAALTTPVKESLTTTDENTKTPTQPISLQKFKGGKKEAFPLEEDEALQKMVELYLQRILLARQKNMDNIALKARNRLEQLINNYFATFPDPRDLEAAAKFIYELLKQQRNETIQADINVLLDHPKICEARIRDLTGMLRKHSPIVSSVKLLDVFRNIYSDFKDGVKPHDINSRLDNIEQKLNEAKVANENIINDKIFHLKIAIKKYGCSDDLQQQLLAISNAEEREESDLRVNRHLDRLLDEMKLEEPEEANVHHESTIDYEALLEEAKKTQTEVTKPSGARSWHSAKVTPKKAPTDDDEPQSGPE